MLHPPAGESSRGDVCDKARGEEEEGSRRGLEEAIAGEEQREGELVSDLRWPPLPLLTVGGARSAKKKSWAEDAMLNWSHLAAQNAVRGRIVRTCGEVVLRRGGGGGRRMEQEEGDLILSVDSPDQLLAAGGEVLP